jgi:hypothetical protein
VLGLAAALLLSLGGNVWQYFDARQDAALAQQQHEADVKLAREQGKLAAANEYSQRVEGIAQSALVDSEATFTRLRRLLGQWEGVATTYAREVAELELPACPPGRPRVNAMNKALEHVNETRIAD